MSIQSIVQLLVLVGETKTKSDLVTLLESLLKTYGFEYYGVLTQPKSHENPMKMMLAGHWPAGWRENYIAKKYILIDPAIRIMGIAHRSFRWREASAMLRNDPLWPRAQRMMQDSGRHGLNDGYTFPVHGRGGLLGSMMISSSRSVDLSPAEMALFETAAKKVFWRLMEFAGEAKKLEKATALGAPLTRREMEVIGLLADGMTSHDIARTLSISNHTVDWYINGLQDKLNARNRQHLVAFAFRHGLVA
ncbi:LuxR family transcriptional regulator [Rhizobium sp. LCM 4573]|uniref:helix-turn-helix transcriptional regulator n=1 Tax=Rhizobium sp. LCM 4573 TaxID=1848291 RepID=UPI0008D9624B|nr:LuxR family transcriptional regulator [Rhizobium sp. LCM 4573]OHV82221.1 LuxR family transcriptional regulator [Rhizobium sp. LCM 4573]